MTLFIIRKAERTVYHYGAACVICYDDGTFLTSRPNTFTNQCDKDLWNRAIWEKAS